MSSGWEESAQAWLAAQGANGDWSRVHVLDPAMLERIDQGQFTRALDVGCGEGRFCRMLRTRGIAVTGIDPTVALLDAARSRDPGGDYRLASAEALPFADDSFDLVVSYLSLMDIRGYRDAIAEMARVLAPGGTLLIASLSSMSTAANGWTTDDSGARVHTPVDRYLEEFSMRSEWDGISIVNYHRPLSAYMRTLLETELRLTLFDEPEPRGGDPERGARYRRFPWLILMEWRDG